MSARATLRIEWDNAALGELKGKAIKATSRRAADKTKQRVQQNIRASGRVRTGRMVNSVAVTVARQDNNRLTYYVGSTVPYATWQNDGIGPVHAKRGRVLAFQPKGSSVVIFRPRTRGFTGAHFYEKALRALTKRDFMQ